MALVVGGYYYVNGGQVMSTDNAYIQADMVGLTTDVSGIVAQIDVHENEAVKKGQVLFRLRPDSFKIALDGAKAQLGTQRNQILTLKASYQQSLAEIDAGARPICPITRISSTGSKTSSTTAARRSRPMTKPSTIWKPRSRR